MSKRNNAEGFYIFGVIFDSDTKERMSDYVRHRLQPKERNVYDAYLDGEVDSLPAALQAKVAGLIMSFVASEKKRQLK